MGGKRKLSLDLRQLEYFVALADAETISGAASRLGITQPSLSEALTRLESQLDVLLVLRGAQGTHLTAAGAALANCGRDILKNVDVALEEVRHHGSETRGLVAVGLPQGMAHLLSIPLSETVQIELPTVRLRITEGASQDVLGWLASGQIDFAVVGQHNEDRGVEARPLLDEELFLVAASDNWPPAGKRLAPGEPIEFKELKGLPLVLPGIQNGPREFIERFAQSNAVQLDVVVEIDSQQQIARLISRSAVYSIMSHASVMSEVSKGELVIVPIVNPMLRQTAYLTRNRSRPVTRASTAVERLLSIILKEMIGRYRLRAELVE
jgi:LysR family nitrogen assimilation transcriptional regulator